MIRRQARFLGKPVRASTAQNTGTILRKSTERDEISQANAWNAQSFGIQPTPSALSLRCSAERSMPTNSAVREILPEKRLIWAIR
jgi:predicted component of type VI protein secretion system